jgi:hypothetical protein
MTARGTRLMNHLFRGHLEGEEREPERTECRRCLEMGQTACDCATLPDEPVSNAYTLPEPHPEHAAILRRTGECLDCWGCGFQPLQPNEDKWRWSDDLCAKCGGTGYEPKATP